MVDTSLLLTFVFVMSVELGSIIAIFTLVKVILVIEEMLWEGKSACKETSNYSSRDGDGKCDTHCCKLETGLLGNCS